MRKRLQFLPKSEGWKGALSHLLTATAVALALTSCGLYDKYEQKTEVPANTFGMSMISNASSDSTTLAQLSWREFFTDPLLQQLI